MTTNADSRPTHKVLVIDNDPQTITLLSKLFERRLPQVEIVGAVGGIAGLEMAARVKPDLILLDLMMADIDGFEVLQRLKNDPDLCHVQVVMHSHRGDPEAVNQGLELGADDYLTRPTLPNTLIEKVSKFLDVNNSEADDNH